jgi:hypothetical protein
VGIWWAKRKLTHEGDLQSLLSTHILLADIAVVKSNNLVRQVQALSAHAIKGWSPPPSGVMKIHVDELLRRCRTRVLLEWSVGMSGAISKVHRLLFLGQCKPWGFGDTGWSTKVSWRYPCPGLADYFRLPMEMRGHCTTALAWIYLLIILMLPKNLQSCDFGGVVEILLQS